MSPLLRTPLSTEHALLGFVRHEPLHGYEIHRRLTETAELRMVWRMKQSRLYAMLTRLEEDGLLEAVLEPQDSRPPRKVYRMTKMGAKAFAEWLTTPVEIPREMRLDFMLKLYFAVEEGQQAVAELVRRQRAVCAGWLIAQDSDSDPDSGYMNAVRRYRRAHIKAISEWLASLVDEPVPGDSRS